ncbi:MAG: TonB-dependent receptor [Sphingobacteriales bacterium]|nr:MAG: TonB-dependent receptor [Sphingobacteriales bacterium]
MYQRIVILIALVFSFHLAEAQNEGASGTGTIKGFVYEKESGEPMSYINVVIRGTRMAVQTDLNGYFSLPQVPAGTHTIWTTLMGYDTATATITIKPNEIITQKLYLSQAGLTLKSVEVSSRRTEKITQINAGSTTITPREMKLLPSAGGEPDLAQYLQVMPGVIFTGDQGGQLYIRGGAPSQTGILLDGVTIYNPFHSIGLYSVFETDAIRNVEVQSAGFNAQYGNRTSAILDIRTKDGNKNRLSGKLSGSPIMVRGMLEGPIAKAKRPDGGSVSFLLSVKHSYLEQTSKAIYGSFGKSFEHGLPYGFTDIFGKLTFSGENGSKLNLFSFNFDDNARALDTGGHERASFNWKAKGGGATFIVTPGNSAALISGKFAYSRYDIAAAETGFTNRTRNSGIDGFEGGIDFTYFLPGFSQVRYGIEVSGLHTTLSYVNSNNIQTSLDRRNTLGSIFFMYRKNINEKFIFEPGIRVQYYSSLSKVSPEPRIGVKYNATDNIRFKGAAGVYSQNIISTKSDLDIVNFFNGFLLSPDQEIKDTEGNPVSSNLQTAYHLIGGVEVDIQDFEFNLEPWYKNFSRNIELNRVKKTINDADFTAGTGKAFGIDLSGKYSKGRIFFWGVVSYQKVTYKTLVAKSVLDVPSVQEYAPPFDRRFNMNIVSSYQAGRKKDIELSLRYNLGSPFPFTQTQGFFEDLNSSQNGINTDNTTQNGNLGIVYADQINGGRLSYYHRLDLSAKKRFDISANTNVETTLSVTNAYNRNNIFYIGRETNTRVYQLPIFPSVNVTLNF